MEIENEGLFRHALCSGINLFLGAGFSLKANSLSERDGRQIPLPTGAGLRDELVDHFRLPQFSRLALPQLSQILSSQFRDGFHDYLRKRLTVSTYDNKYKNIFNANIGKIFTTNLDNLIHRIYEESSDLYIHDVDIHGANPCDGAAIPYYALHGGVVSGKEYIFTPTEIATAFSSEQDTWHLFRREVSAKDTLFWGHNLDDADVLQAIAGTARGVGEANKWILVYNADEATSAYFRSLGFQIISGDTISLLSYLSTIGGDEKKESASITKGLFLENRVPHPSQVPQRPISQFFRGSAPMWSDIYSPNIHVLSFEKKIKDAILLNKNVVIVGLPLSGKSTLLMQVAASIKLNKHQLFFDSMTIEKAKLIVRSSKEKGESVIAFIDNFVDSVDAIMELISNGIQVVGTDRTYVYDSVSFRFNTRQLSVINITDITNSDIQKIYDTIPVDIRKRKMATDGYKDTEGMYVFDIIENNVSLPRLRDRFKGVLKEIGSKDRDVLDLLIMMSYVHECRTPVSYDMIYIFLDKAMKQYGDVALLVEKLHELAKEYDGGLIDDHQYFYSPRSSAIASAVIDVCKSGDFRRIFPRFHDVISPMIVPSYDIFRRYAYDAKYASKAYPRWEDGKAFYEKLVRKTDNPYDWQHGALYLAQKREYADAFRWIDVAIGKSGSRIFSIRNSHAKILFDANIPFARASGDQVKSDLDRSMDTLKSCYNNDRRKAYHAMRFADQAMQYSDVYNDKKSKEYLEIALNWLKEQEVTASWNTQIIRLTRDVARKLSGFDGV